MDRELNSALSPLLQDQVQAGARMLLLPLGEIKGRDGRYWELSESEAERLVSRIVADGLDIVLDYNHGTYGGNGEAAGWFSQFETSLEGITAVLELTADGKESVAKREYRYLSPAFLSEGTTILQLESVGLVNTPNLAQLPALNGYGKDQTDMEKGMDKEKELELNRLRTEQAELNRQLVTNKDETQALLLEVNTLKCEIAKRDQDLATNAVVALVDKALAEGKLAPAQKDSAVKLGLNNREDLENFISASPLNLTLLAQNQRDKAVTGAQSLSDAELHLCKTIGLKPDDFQKAKIAFTSPQAA